MAMDKKLIDAVIQNRTLSHLLFWTSFLLLFTTLASLNTSPVKMHILNHASMLPAQIGAAYFLNYFQIPKLLFKKKYLWFTLSMMLAAYLFSAFARISIVYGAEPFLREDFTQESLTEIFCDTGYLFGVYFPATYTHAFIMLIIKVIKGRFEEKHQIEILEKEKVVNELKFLKTQIQPHFLFNTLNNLYALTLSKSDVAPKVVLKLSALLDFILYQSNEPTIPIEKEIELIKGFAELEALRYGEKLVLSFNPQFDDPYTPIAPLMLLPLVENAFKHGSKGSQKKTQVDIGLIVQGGQLTFDISNSKATSLEWKKQENYGIGMTNLKRQLALNYPDRHTIQVEETDEVYRVNLRIDLIEGT